jgi:TPR repeat protein
MKSAAEAGHADAMGGIGYFYHTGTAIEKDDLRAAEWFRKGAEAGSAKAQFNLGSVLFEGRGVTRNEIEAWPWWERAAGQGLPEALVATANAYYFGDHGQVKNLARAYPLYRQAAEAGVAYAQNVLGLMLCHGRGVKKDVAEGRNWLQTAAWQGHPKAPTNIANLILSAPRDRSGEIEALAWLFVAEGQKEIAATKRLAEILPGTPQDQVEEARRQAARWQQVIAVSAH